MTVNDNVSYHDNCYDTFKLTCSSTVSSSRLKQKNRREKRQRLLKKSVSKALVSEFPWGDYRFRMKTPVVNLWRRKYLYPKPTDITIRPQTRQQSEGQISFDDHQEQKTPRVKIKKGWKQINEIVIQIAG